MNIIGDFKKVFLVAIKNVNEDSYYISSVPERTLINF